MVSRESELMNVVIRVDASVIIGSGHVMRCLTIANALRGKKALVNFICKDFEGSMCEVIEYQGFKVYRLPEVKGLLFAEEDKYQSADILSNLQKRVDWLIVDGYNLDSKWENHVRPLVEKIMVIDDLANRSHDCDVLLDQDAVLCKENRYKGLINKHCKAFFGPKYAVLRPEFYDAKKNLRLRNGIVQRILVFFGGSDFTNETQKVLQAIAKIEKNIIVDVVVGISNPHRQKIKKICSEDIFFNYHCQIDYMAELMNKADLAIGAGGGATWERCCMGLPALVTILADNQHQLTVEMASRGAIINMGWYTDITDKDYYQAIIALAPSKILSMQEQALLLVDGQGCDRVIEYLIGI